MPLSTECSNFVLNAFSTPAQRMLLHTLCALADRRGQFGIDIFFEIYFDLVGLIFMILNWSRFWSRAGASYWARHGARDWLWAWTALITGPLYQGPPLYLSAPNVYLDALGYR